MTASRDLLLALVTVLRVMQFHQCVFLTEPANGTAPLQSNLSCSCNVSHSERQEYIKEPGHMLPRQASDPEFRVKLEKYFAVNVTEVSLNIEQKNESDPFWTLGAQYFSQEPTNFRLHIKRMYDHWKSLKTKVSRYQYLGFNKNQQSSEVEQLCLCNPVSVITWKARFLDLKYDKQMEDLNSVIFRDSSELVRTQVLNSTGLLTSSEINDVIVTRLSNGSVVAHLAFLSSANVENSLEMVKRAIAAKLTQTNNIVSEMFPSVENCSSSPPGAVKYGSRMWSGSVALGTVVKYTCQQGYRFASGLDSHYSTCETGQGTFTYLPRSAYCVNELNESKSGTNTINTADQWSNHTDQTQHGSGASDQWNSTAEGVHFSTASSLPLAGSDGSNMSTVSRGNTSSPHSTQAADTTASATKVSSTSLSPHPSTLFSATEATSFAHQNEPITETAVSVRLRFTSMQWNPRYNDSSSPEAVNLFTRIADLLQSELTSADSRVKRVVVSALSAGSVLADTQIVVNDSNINPQSYVERAVRNATSDGSLANETIDSNFTQVTVLQCSNTPSNASEGGYLVWSGAVNLGSVASYFCHSGYNMVNGSGYSVDQPFNIRCASNGTTAVFALFPSQVTCQTSTDPNNPTSTDTTTSTTATSTTATSTTAMSTTASGLRPPVATRAPLSVKKLPLFSTMIYSITIPVAAGILAFVVVCLCCLRVDSPLCRMCEEGKLYK